MQVDAPPPRPLRAPPWLIHGQSACGKPSKSALRTTPTLEAGRSKATFAVFVAGELVLASSCCCTALAAALAWRRSMTLALACRSGCPRCVPHRGGASLQAGGGAADHAAMMRSSRACVFVRACVLRADALLELQPGPGPRQAGEEGPAVPSLPPAVKSERQRCSGGQGHERRRQDLEGVRYVAYSRLQHSNCPAAQAAGACETGSCTSTFSTLDFMAANFPLAISSQLQAVCVRQALVSYRLQQDTAWS